MLMLSGIALRWQVCVPRVSLTSPASRATAAEGHWRGDVGGHLRRVATDLVGRPMRHGGVVFSHWWEEKQYFFKETKLLALLRMAHHMLVSDPNNCSFLSLSFFL